jgi:ABC-type glutathione transport system ATPase component
MHALTGFVLEVRGLSKTFTQGHWWRTQFHYRALDNVSLQLSPKTTLALVGKSGCGKTTLAMCLVGLEQPDAAEIYLDGTNVLDLDNPLAIAARREIQLIFQDSSSALNPHMSAAEIVEEPLQIRGRYTRKQRAEIAAAMMEQVGLSAKWADRKPSEFSGGQRQRLAIARALTLQPKVLILDEIFVGLDLSIQGQIANLLLDLQQSCGLSYICISHNLALVSEIADTVLIMDKGQIVERRMPNDLLLPNASPSAESKNVTPVPSALGAHSGA